MTEPGEQDRGALSSHLLDAVATRAVTGLRIDLGQVRRQARTRRRNRLVAGGGAALAVAAAVLTAVRLTGGPTDLPTPLPVAADEVCQEYSPATAALSPGRDAVTAEVGGVRQPLVRLPESTSPDAVRVSLDLARRHTAHCVIGDPATGLQFWKDGGSVAQPAAATGPGVTCIGYDPRTVTITAADGRWSLLASPDVLLATTASAPDAARALLVARQASRLCLVGDRDEPVTWYWVR